MNGTAYPPRSSATDGPSPTTQAERNELIDTLRGVALFGVLWVNTMWFATGAYGVPAAELNALPTAPLDRWVSYVLDVFVYAKANTLFGFLFGVSFAIQMSRLEKRSPHPARHFARRLVGLLVIGTIHLFCVWKGEILHVYAVAGFALLLVWRWPTMLLVGAGLVLALAALPALTQWQWAHAFLSGGVPAPPVPDEALASQLTAFREGDYLEVLAVQREHMWRAHYFLAGFLPWILYALGRFMLGMAVMRYSFLTDPEIHWRTFRFVALLGLPAGLLCSVAARALQWLRKHGCLDVAQSWIDMAGWLVPVGTLLMTAAYVAMIAWAWRVGALRRWLSMLAPCGQMALTNYVLQSCVNSVLFFGYGIGLVGRVGYGVCLLLTVSVFTLQAAFSRAWLARYRFGPLEWAWRWWTYQRRPGWRRGREHGAD